MTNEERIKRAQAADRLLKHELMVEVREHMRQRLLDAGWHLHKMAPEDQRRHAAMVDHFDNFFGWFKRVITDGEVAEMEEKQKSAAAEALAAMRKKLRI